MRVCASSLTQRALKVPRFARSASVQRRHAACAADACRASPRTPIINRAAPAFVEKPEELQTTRSVAVAALTDERAELGAPAQRKSVGARGSPAQKACVELEALRAEKTKQKRGRGTEGAFSLVVDQQRVARQVPAGGRADACRIRQRAKGRAPWSDEDDEHQMPSGAKIAIGTVVISQLFLL